MYKLIILDILYPRHVLKVMLIKYLYFVVLVNVQYKHANREDFMTLGLRQELLNVEMNIRINQLRINFIT